MCACVCVCSVTTMEENSACKGGWGAEEMSPGERQDTGIWRAWRTSSFVFAVLLPYCLLPQCMGINAKLPLVSEDRPAPSLYRKEPGCIQDSKHYRFEEKWSPVLIPRGKMHCVKCECLTVERKGIIQPRGKVKCKNIKDDCPKPQCDHPVLLPDRCCKICLGSPDNDFESEFTFRPKGQVTGIYNDDQLPELYKVNEFRALLVGRHVRGESMKTTSVGIIHITAVRGELRYAVRYSKLDRPKFLQITDANGSILLDTPIEKRRKRDKKLCGVWTKIPAIYVGYFRQGRLFAVITTSKHPKGLIAGRVMPNDMASTEVFSSVLSSPIPNGVGGMASFEYDPSSRIVKYVIHVDSMVDPGVGAEYHVSISKKTRVLHQSLASTSPLTTKIAGSWKMTKKRERKQLARGRLRLRVTSQSGSQISGIVYPRLMCGVFQAVLSGSNALQKNEATSAGSAIVELGPSGGLEYKIHVMGLDSRVSKIRLEGSVGKRKQKIKQRTVGILQRPIFSDNSSFDGWANGTYKKLEAKDIYNLLNNKLFINIVTARNRISQLRGRLVQAPYHSQLKTLDAPFTLQPISGEARGGAAHAWLSMSLGCLLHYDAVLAGYRHKNEVQDVGTSFSVLLGTHHTGRSQTLFPLRPDAGHVISSQFEYNVSSGSVNDVPQQLIKDLHEGKAYLQIISGPEDKAVFKGNVTLPNSCWQYVRDHQPVVSVSEDSGQVCAYEHKRYQVGDAWLPVVNSSCFTCSCMKGGKLKCHEKLCPPLPCDNPVKLHNECCPTCPEESWQEHCKLDEDPRQYPLHHTWHPFLPLTGFSKCAVCTCKGGNSVDCGRIHCPKLNCPESEQKRRSKEDCCRVCDPKLGKDAAIEIPLLDIDMEGACNFLGEWKPEGTVWHPRVKPFGHLKCFVCNCTNGKFSCGRKECPALRCKNKIKNRDSCCDQCSDDQFPDSDGGKSGKKKCTLGENVYEHRSKWRPPASPHGNARCVRCTCKNGEVRCRIRCPKKCRTDRSSSPCCRHCPDEKRTKKSKSKSRKRQNRRANRKNRAQKGFPLT